MYLIIGLLPPPVQGFPSLYQSQLPSLSSVVASRAKCWDVGDEQICTSGGARSCPGKIFLTIYIFAALFVLLSSIFIDDGVSRECSDVQGLFQKPLHLSVAEKLANGVEIC